MADDWRIRIDVVDVHDTVLEKLGVELDDEARELARDLERNRLAVSRGGDEVFVYASSRGEAERARAVIEAHLRSRGHEARATTIEHWLEDEERWDDEPKGETWEQEELDHGFAPWEVRVTVPSRKQAHALADQLEAEGYHALRRFQYLIVGAGSKEDAEALAERLHGQVEGGGEVVDEVSPGNPFSIFGGLGA